MHLIFIMRLSAFTDYSLRVLMYLGSDSDRLATIGEIARMHGISENHLMKVVHQLAKVGYVESLRGKGGGIRLAREPQAINLGEVIRLTESDFALAECLGGGVQCRILPSCRMKAILSEGVAALFLVLDAYTLADLLADPGGRPLPLAAPATLPTGSPS